MPKPPRPISTPPTGLRQRYRARSDDWRVWWEPNGPQRTMGLKPVELDGSKPTWSVREAERLNLQAAKSPRPPTTAAPIAKNSIDALRIAYLKSPLFLTKKPKTKSEYKKDIARIMERWQGTDLRNMTKPIMFTWYEKLYTNNGAWMARRLIRMLSIMMSYAELKGMIAMNPLLRMKMISPKGRARTATWEEFDALDAATEQLGWSKMRLAIYLSMFQGQRETDIINARVRDFALHLIDPSDQSGNRQLCWKLVRSKDTTLQRLNYLAVHPEALPLVQDAIRRSEAPASLLVTRDIDGAAYNDDTAFPYFFAKLREVAAETCPSIYNLQFRDLRRTFSDNSRHANVAGHDVDDALGNTSGTDANLRQVYMPASDIKAADAILAVKRPDRPDKKKRA